MSKYTSGELAKLCNISVRTVQFYDSKGLLHPTELTDGGWRLYTDDDLIKLRLICMIKFFGISLDSIQGILNSDAPAKVLTLLLDEQLKRLDSQRNEMQKQIDAIKIIKESIRHKEAIPVNSINDIEHMMKNKKGLRKVRITLLIGAILTILPWWGTIAWWILKGIWIPFAIYTPIHLIICLFLVQYLRRNTDYICPECNKVFRPTMRNFMFTSGNKTRWLTCPECGHAGYCVEVYKTD